MRRSGTLEEVWKVVELERKREERIDYRAVDLKQVVGFSFSSKTNVSAEKPFEALEKSGEKLSLDARLTQCRGLSFFTFLFFSR